LIAARRPGLLTLLCLLLTAGGAAALAAPIDDPFPLRNQLPFNLLWLDQTPRGATLPGPRETRLTIHVAYENTLVATDSLVSLFREDDFATFDGRVTRPVLEGIAAGTPGGTAFFLDGETLRTSIDARFGISRRFEAGIEVPLLLHSGGLFDGTIDGYHDRFGFPDGGRPVFARDRFVAGYVGDGASVFIEGPPGGVGLGDVVLSGRLALSDPATRATAIALALELKLPTGDPDRLEGSGSLDYGASLQMSRAFGRHTLHAGYGYAAHGEWDLAPSLPVIASRSLYGAWAIRLTPRSALIAQVLRSTGSFPFRPGNDLGRLAHEIALGIRHRTARGPHLEAALIENLSRSLNTPDIGIFVGVGLPLRGRTGPSTSRGETP